MKKLLSLLTLIPFFALAQSTEDEPILTEALNFVEEMPEYPGGENGMMNFIKSNFVMPKTTHRVIVAFVVDENGNVENPTIKQSVTPKIDNEALRVVKLLKFKPGKTKGKPVKVNFTLPIAVSLTD